MPCATAVADSLCLLGDDLHVYYKTIFCSMIPVKTSLVEAIFRLLKKGNLAKRLEQALHSRASTDSEQKKSSQSRHTSHTVASHFICNAVENVVAFNVSGSITPAVSTLAGYAKRQNNAPKFQLSLISCFLRCHCYCFLIKI